MGEAQGAPVRLQELGLERQVPVRVLVRRPGDRSPGVGGAQDEGSRERARQGLLGVQLHRRRGVQGLTTTSLIDPNIHRMERRMFVSSRRGWSLLVIPLALLAYVRHGIAGNDQEVTYLPPDEDSPDDGQCVAAAENNAPGDLPVGDSRPFGPDVVRVPAHMTSAELTSATWGVIPEQYLDSWLLYDGGNFLWKRSRTAPAGDELDAGAVSWTGLDDGGQELPRARGSGS